MICLSYGILWLQAKNEGKKVAKCQCKKKIRKACGKEKHHKDILIKPHTALLSSHET